MSDTMRSRLQQSDYIFSGIKTFHELNEAFPSLIDENGNRKPFAQFLNDVRKIDQTYNRNYLPAFIPVCRGTDTLFLLMIPGACFSIGRVSRQSIGPLPSIG